ncbi:MAG TPA: FadR/GntR family transcriptional regulator [Pirellulales bacterium]|nr:FadR/GntR family transcriptional regulator [Pirellulales bacterium]HVA50610.1 FadR/GntR family transcriptional regulator [Pirellulales bacterium]HVA50631.1 FadR/GntR family transcriptional regulator [Pirellulales bacterium]
MSRVDRVSEVVQALEDKILSGGLNPGDPLPSEREISTQLGVSRTVVREAIGRLAGLGLVRSIQGSGTRVAAPSGRQISVGYQRLLRWSDCRLEDLAAVRLPLETAIAASAAIHRTEVQLASLEETQQTLGNPAKSLKAHLKADLDFHAILAEATGNAMFHLVLAPIQELLIESRRQTLGRHGAALAHRHHADILAAVVAGDARLASQAMREHIEANFQHLRAAATSVDAVLLGDQPQGGDTIQRRVKEFP